MSLNEQLIRELVRAERKTKSGYNPLNIDQHIGLYLMFAYNAAMTGNTPITLQSHLIRVDELITMRNA